MEIINQEMRNILKKCFNANDILLLVVTIVLVILSWISIRYFDKPSDSTLATCIAAISVIIVDLYLMLILILSAIRSDEDSRSEEKEWEKSSLVKYLFPSRTVGLFLVGMFLMVLVFGFAGIYYHLPTKAFEEEIASRIDAVYFSFVTITTLGYGDIHPSSNEAKRIVLYQLISGTLLLVGILSFLISRIVTFESQNKS